MVMPRSAALAQLQVWSGDPPWRGGWLRPRLSAALAGKTAASDRHSPSEASGITASNGSYTKVRLSGVRSHRRPSSAR
jgi:hypothetical protein